MTFSQGTTGHQCIICEAEVVAVGHSAQPALCRDIQCRRLHEQRLTMTPAVYAPHLALQTSLIRQRRAAEAQRKALIERVSREEEADNQAVLEAFQAATGRDDVVDMVMLPSVTQRCSAVDEQRRASYILHLQTVMAEAVACEDVSHLTQDQHYTLIDRRVAQDAFLADNPRIANRSDTLCALCRGGCCMEGGNHGYVSAVMLRRQLDADDGLSPEILLEDYIRHIPDYAIAGGCINQGETGCTLPRNRRSDVCNYYLCQPLRDHQTTLLQAQSAQPLFVVQRSNHHWNRFASEKANELIACYVIADDDCQEITDLHYPAQSEPG